MKWLYTSLLISALAGGVVGCKPEPLVVPGSPEVPGEDDAMTPPPAGLTEDPGAPEPERPAPPQE